MAKRLYNGPILVTGGNGAIGRFVVEELRGMGIEALPLGRDISASKDAGTVRGDINDLDGLARIIREHRVDAVIHLAALLVECEQRPLEGFRTNTGGTATVLEAVRETGIRRVVVASSKAAFGPLGGEWGYPHYRPIAEDHARRPRGMYGLSKMLAEDMVLHYRAERGVDAVIMRFGTSCGPGKGARHGSSTITSTMIENAADGIATIVEQGGDERDDIIYNRDVAHGMVLAALAPRLSHAVYHLGTGRLITLHELASAIRLAVPAADIQVGPGLDFMNLGMGNYCLMSTARAGEFGFAPRFSLEQWVADYVDLYRRSQRTSAESA